MLNSTFFSLQSLVRIGFPVALTWVVVSSVCSGQTASPAARNNPAAEASSSAPDTGAIERFQSESIRHLDRFETDSRKDYKIAGEVEWSPLKVTMKSGSTMAYVQRLDAEIRLEFDLWPAAMEESERSESRINMVLTQNYELVISIHRGMQDGTSMRQVTIAEVVRNPRPNTKPTVNLLRRSAPFSVQGDMERWRLDYRNGLVQLSCNRKRIATGYCEGFSAWINVIALSQPTGEVVLSRWECSGKTVDYTPQQRQLYNRSQELMQLSQQKVSEGDLPGAVEARRAAIDVCTEAFGPTDFSLAIQHRWIAATLRSLREHEQAKQDITKAVEIFEKTMGPNHPETLTTKFTAAGNLALAGKPEEGVAGMREALRVYLKLVGPEGPSAQSCLTQFASALRAQAERKQDAGDYHAAERLYREVVSIDTRVHGQDHWQTRFDQEEFSLMKRCLTSTGRQRERLVEMFELLAKRRALYREGNVEQANDLQAPYLATMRKLLGDKHPKVGAELLSLAIEQFNRGEIDASMANGREAVAIYAENFGKESPLYHIATGMLGSQLSMVERFDEAEKMLTESCQALESTKFGNTTVYAQMEVELGRHLMRVGDLKQAANHLLRGLQLYHSLGEYTNTNALKALERIADIFRQAGQVAQAEQFTEMHRNLVQAAYGKQSAAYIDVLTADARHLFMRRKFDAAVSKYQQAGKLVERFYGKRSRAYENVFQGLIDVHLYRNDMAAVVQQFEERLEWELQRRESLFNIYDEQQQIDRTVQDMISLDGLLFLALEGHLDPARAYRHALAFKGAVTARQRRARIAARSPNIRKLHQQLEKVQAELDRLSASFPSSTKLPTGATPLSGPEVTNTTRSEEQAKVDESLANRTRLVERREALQRELAEQNKAYALAARRTTPEELRKAMPAGTVLVDYVEYVMPRSFLGKLFGTDHEMGIAAFVMDEGGQVRLVKLGKESQVTKILLAWRESMALEPYYELESGETTLAQISDQRGAMLRKLIWDPIARHVEGADTIVISPSALLSACPFAALPVEGDANCLIEKHAISTIVTPRLLPELLDKRYPAEDARLLLVGDIDYGPTATMDATPMEPFFAELKFDEMEIDSIRSTFASRQSAGKVDLLRGKQALEADVRRLLPAVRFAHLSTHGFLFNSLELEELRAAVGVESATTDEALSDREPFTGRWKPGIALGNGNRGMLVHPSKPDDGVLWADEITEIDLSNAELVTLSACQTAVGKLVPGEGMLGAQRAIYVAGAQSSLTALWAVEALSTRELMKQFYINLWQAKQPKAKALQQAMIFMMHQHEWRDATASKSPRPGRTPPALWSGFVLHGDWR